MRIWRKSHVCLIFLLIYGTNAWWPFGSNEVDEPKPDIGQDLTKNEVDPNESGRLFPCFIYISLK
jgi:hypothetical protein